MGVIENILVIVEKADRGSRLVGLSGGQGVIARCDETLEYFIYWR